MVYVVWNQTHSVLGDQLGSLMHMAMSLVTELGLNKEHSSEAKLSHGVPGEASKNREHQPLRTNDGRRCYLGVFWLNSTLNSCAKYTVPMPTKPYINDSCSYLQAAMESPWDTYLVQLVRIQEIYNSSNSILDGSSNNKCQTSQRFFMETSQVERQVQELGTTLRQESSLQAPLAMSFHMLQAFVYKFGVDKQLRLISEASDPSSPTLRYSYLVVSGLSAVKAVIEKFLLLSASTILSMPYTYWIQIVHCVEMFARLLVTHPTLWDPNLFVGVRDFTLTLERIFIKIGGAMGEGASMDPPRHLPATINTMREKLIDICALVGKSSKTMSGSSSLTTTNSQHATHMEIMVMDKETQSLLVNFIRGGSLM
ncbi:Ff.00g022680.m01.CDS01 [Fusarium sp. VM40]|nr:Ff.00g022680.m01.CDS01 [Fusarium sp. VM40]